MSLLLLIDGLKIASASEYSEEEDLPIVHRLAAIGQTGQLSFTDQSREPEEGSPYFDLFGYGMATEESEARDLPLGYLTALGRVDREGMKEPDPTRTYGCLGFTHLYKKQNDLMFLSPERTGQTYEECRLLAESFLIDLQEEGWSIHDPNWDTIPSWQTMPATIILSCAATSDSPIQVRTRPLASLEGDSLRQSQPTGPYAKRLIQLLTSGQLSLARHPLNVERHRTGRVPLNTPWIWGVGRGDERISLPAKSVSGHCWTAHPVMAGLVRARGFQHLPMDESDNFSPLIAPILNALVAGPVLLHLHWPAFLARHGLMEERRAFLQRLHEQLLVPLVQGMIPTKKSLLVSSSYTLTSEGRGENRPVPWVVASGRVLSKKKMFWHRGVLGRGVSLPLDRFRTVWLS